MSHDAYHERLFAYHDGELSPGEAAGVEAHLKECPECRSVLAGWRRAAGVLFPSIAPAEDDLFVRRVMVRVEAEPSGPWEVFREEIRRVFSASRRVWTGAALAGAAVLAAFILALSFPRRPASLDTAEEATFISELVEGASASSTEEGFGTDIESYLL